MSLESEVVRLGCAWGDWLFYQSGYLAPSYALNLRTGERQELLDGELSEVMAVADDELVVWTEENGYIYLNEDGNQRPVASEEYTWFDGDDTEQYFSWRMRSGAGYNRAYGRLRNGEAEAIFALHDSMVHIVVDGVLYMQGSSSFRLISDECRLVDVTGENAEAVAEANDTRIFESGGDTLTLALMPDGTLYLLNREA